MMLIVVWVLVALVAAGGVLAVAARLTSETAPSTFLTDLRSGLRSSRGDRGLAGTRGPGVLAGARREHMDVADVETSSVGDLFRVGRPAERDYLDPEQLSAGIARTIGRASHTR